MYYTKSKCNSKKCKITHCKAVKSKQKLKTENQTNEWLYLGRGKGGGTI